MSPKTGKSTTAAAASSSPSSSSGSAAAAAASAEKPEPKAKIDPSFKSKRYRDKLRTEVKALEALLPVDRTALSRKLDSQTVFRLVLALLRIKGYFQGAGLQQVDTFFDVSRTYDATVCDDVDADDVTSLIEGLGCLQVLEGFLLVLTADGTILYVSDNVLQYLGYNQVDLMHRCVYSIVHYDDMADLKMVLESSLAHLLVPSRYPHPPGVPQEGTCRVEDCGGGVAGTPGGDMSSPVSFICRMRCFSGSSVGYLKMHCSGKLVRRAGVPQSKRSSGDVLLLFCNPFMLRASEFNPQLHNSVFWTKHDLDLQVKEMDVKGTDIIGFTPEEIEKQSFYSLVHPEDLTALATCHKLLLESSEVQTVYFRLQTNGGDWVWLTSRGKVISKNSKKISIAFSHCPLREEDSTYIQQEVVLRRRYALTDLMYLRQLRQTLPEPPSSSSSSFCSPSTHPHRDQAQASSAGSKSRKAMVAEGADQYPPPYPLVTPASSSSSSSGRSGSARAGVGGKGGGGKEEEEGAVDTSCVLELACPSAWHGMSDRHSPVLPSSHVAHKLSQREKQLQFQEFCKRQQMGAGGSGSSTSQTKFSGNSWEGVSPFSLPVAPDFASSSSRMPGQDNASPAGPATGGSVVDPNAPYPKSSASFGTYESCVGYNPVNAPGSSVQQPSFAPSWYGCGSAPRVNHAVPNDCSATPGRSPHQCGVTENMLGFSQVTNQFSVFQPPPPAFPAYGPVSDPPPLLASAYSSMPPSPPPSPPPAGSLPLPAQQTVGVESSHTSVEHNQHYRPEFGPSWLQPGFSNNPVQPSVPICGYRNDAASSGHCMSVITDLEKTTEKFLPPLKKKRQGEVVLDSRGKLPARAGQGSCQNGPGRWGTGAWTVNGQLDVSWKGSHTVPSTFRQINVNGSVHLQQTVPNCSQCPPYPHGHQGYHNAHVAAPGPVFHAAVQSQQSYPYSSTTLYPHFGSPPAYPYGVYPQLGYQGGQYPVNSFYSTTPSVPLKVNTDFPCPPVERPLDLPSIGSFLEYLCEV